jgi:Zn-dependent protease with chaperone function
VGYLIHTLLALACLAVAEEQPELGEPWPWAQPLLLLLPYAAGLFVRRAALRGRFRAAELGFGCVHWSAPGLYLVSLLGLGWLDSIERWTGERPSLLDWPSFALLLALAPFAAFGLACVDARARLVEAPAERARSRRFHARLFLSSLVPVCLYIGIAGAVGLAPRVRVLIDEVRLLGAAFGAALVLLFVAVLPAVLASTWSTTPLPGGLLRELFAAVARRARFTCRRILVWHTGRQMANAAIVGFLPHTRLVLLSDALLERLSERELAAVFAHEIGHARRGHVPYFAAWALALFLGGDLVAGWLAPGSELVAAGILAAFLAAWALLFGWMSRRCELDADLFSLETLGDADALASALERVGGLHARRRGSWRHFSTERRIAFLRAVERDPALGRRLRARLRWLGVAGAVLAALVLVQQARELAASYGADRVRASLCLGHWSAAAQRLSRLSPSDEEEREELERLVARAVTLPDSEPATLAARARAALLARDADAARDWLRLGAMREDPEMEVVEEAFWMAVEGEREAARRLLERRAPGWTEAVMEFLAGQ